MGQGRTGWDNSGKYIYLIFWMLGQPQKFRLAKNLTYLKVWNHRKNKVGITKIASQRQAFSLGE